MKKAKKLTKNQYLFERIAAVDKTLGKFNTNEPDEVRFHPWVLFYLLKNIHNTPFFNTEKRRIERELVKKPKIFSSPLNKNIKRPAHPILSVITPSFNHGRFLEDTIHSITAQTFKNFEHIVIDGGSTDETINILKRYSHVKWISERDSGYNEAFGKGLSLARGKFIINCSVSDGFADKNWFKRCIEALDSQPDVSLVWGFPQNLSEDGIPGKISYAQFHLKPAPQKDNFFYFWLRTGHGFPEGNFCVRKNILKKCLTGLNRRSKDCHIWKEFTYNFETMGYFPYNISVVANYGRAHGGQLGQKDQETGVEQKLQKIYLKKIQDYRQSLIFGKRVHIFRGSNEKILPVKFSVSKLASEYFQDVKKRIKFQFSRLI